MDGGITTILGKVKELFTGMTTCSALTTDGKCYVWGWNGRDKYGEVWMGNYSYTFVPILIEIPNETIVHIAFGDDFTCYLTAKGNMDN